MVYVESNGTRLSLYIIVWRSLLSTLWTYKDKEENVKYDNNKHNVTMYDVLIFTKQH